MADTREGAPASAAGGCPTGDAIATLLSGKLLPSESMALHGHIRNCRSCAELLVLMADKGDGLATVSSALEPATARSSGESAAEAELHSPGTKVGRFVLQRLIGAGGMGAVWAARDPELGRDVAIKLVQRPGAADSEGQQRALKEAQAMARLSHPNVVAVYDVGAEADRVFIAMELVEGQTLKAWLREKQRPVRTILRVLAQAARGLDAAHRAGLVHRDFKPDNVLVDGQGRDVRARVTDFGLARFERAQAAAAQANGELLDAAALTRAGALVGTPAYMAPEQLEGRSATAASDLFAFCVVLWEALFHERPFAAKSLYALGEAIARGPPRLPASPRLPARVRRLLLQGLKADPAARPPSMMLLVEALEHDSSRVLLRAGILAAATVAIAAVSFSALRERVCAGIERELQGVWGPLERAGLEKAFAARGASWARAAFEGAAGVFDRYTADWVQMKRQSCEATRRAGTQSERLMELRGACLDLRLHELRSLVGLLAQGDEALQRNALKASNQLSPLGACADAAALGAAAPPADPAARQKIRAIRERLAETKALENAGRFEAGRAQATALLNEAKPLAFAPLTAELLVRKATLEIFNEHHDEGVASAREAVFAAESAGALKQTADAWRLLGLSQVMRTQKAEAEESLRHASSLVRGAGGDADLEAAINHVLGGLLLQQARYAEAEATFIALATYYGQARSTDNPDAASALVNAALAAGRQGKRKQAVVLFRQAEERMKRTLEPGHPRLLLLQLNLAVNLNLLGELKQSRALVDEALPLARAARSSLALAVALSVAGQLAAREGRPDEGAALTRESLASFQALRGKENSNWITVAGELGGQLEQAGRHAEARGILEEALALARSHSTDESTAELQARLSQVSLSLGDPADALARARESLALAERAKSLEEQGRAGLALAAALRQSDPEGARQALRAGVAKLQALESPDSALVARGAELEKALALR